MQDTTIAVDLAKSVFEVAVSSEPGVVAVRHRLTRSQFARFLAEQPAATVLMEACGPAHYWAREAEALGHATRLLPPREVRPYVVGNKTDRADAKGLLEADRNEDIRAVPVKTVEQQALAGLHRLRSGWMATRTARLNTLRGLLRELGLTIPTGASRVVPYIRALLANDDRPLPASLQSSFAAACEEIEAIERRVRHLEKELAKIVKESQALHRLRTVPGIGLLTATALVAAIGDPQRFPSGRHLAKFFGLTPREHSTGHTRRLGRITKRGDPYIRTLLIHGARSVLHHAKGEPKPDALRRWGLARERALGHNKAAVAVANKLARIAWAVWSKEQDYIAMP